MSKATFPETTGNESQKPLMDGAVVSSDMRNALSALFQGDISPLRVRAQSTSNMTVIGNSASIQNFFKQVNRNKQPVTFVGGNSPSITAPATNSRIDILYLNNSGSLAWITGSEAASPTANWSSLPDDGIPICTVYCKVGMTAIVNFEDSGANVGQGYIYEDVRPVISLAPASVPSPSGSGDAGKTPRVNAGGTAYDLKAIQNMLKGADVASASTITLGDDGNLFKITGTTQINTITIKAAGTVVSLILSASITLSTSGNLKLSGNVNFSASANDTISFASDGTNWYEIGRSTTAAGVRVKVKTFSRDVSTASGNQAITGIEFTPKAVIFLSIGVTVVNANWGFDDGTTAAEIDRLGNSGNMNHENHGVVVYVDGSNYYMGKITSLDSDGFTIAWTKTGSPTGTLSIKCLAIG